MIIQIEGRLSRDERGRAPQTAQGCLGGHATATRLWGFLTAAASSKSNLLK